MSKKKAEKISIDKQEQMDEKHLAATGGYLSAILDLVDNYNGLAIYLQDRGFGNEYGEPFPTIDISGNMNMVIRHFTDLEEFHTKLPKKQRRW